MNRLNKQTGVIILVENQREQIAELDRLFRVAAIRTPVKISRSGTDAIQYLKGNGIYSDRITNPIPSVMLVDISNPDGSAMELIDWARKQQPFLDIPIIVLIDSDITVATRAAFFDLGANAYIASRNDLSKVVGLIESLDFVGSPSLSEADVSPRN